MGNTLAICELVLVRFLQNTVRNVGESSEIIFLGLGRHNSVETPPKIKESLQEDVLVWYPLGS